MPYTHVHGRALLIAAAGSALVFGGSAPAQPARQAVLTGAASAPAGISRVLSERSPFLGTWELDLSRMPSNYGPPPKSVTYRFEDAGADAWRTSIEIVGRDDSVRRAATVYRTDGKAVKVEGDNIDGDSAAFGSPAPNVLVLCLTGDQGFASVRTWAVSPDGREMTESAASLDDQRVPFVRNFHFRRVG